MPADDHNWNYSDDSGHGPSNWHRYYPAGKQQSPINILVDFCELHQSGCSSCNSTSGQLAHQLERDLHLDDATLAHSNYQHWQQQRRSHLDSLGNEDEQQYYASDQTGGSRSPSCVSEKSAGSDAVQAEGKMSANNCIALWKSKKSTSPLQVRNHQANQQSRRNTRYCVTNKKIFLGYPRFLNSLELSNTGHGWQVDMPRELASHTLLCGPPLGDREYRLAQFHCHWGADCSRGSEHQVNGQSYSAELHFVHWNCSHFRSAEEAAKHKHGLAVLGVFVQALEGEQNRNKHLDKLMAGIQVVREQTHASVELANTKLDLKKLFPANRWDYATYEGSLTTPPLSEVVDWLVFLQPIQCSASQVAEFRRLKCPSGALIENCRPVQPHNQRTVALWTHAHSH